MKSIEFEYQIIKESGKTIDCFTEAKLTDKNIKDVAEFIMADEEHQTGELMDIPGHVYDRFMNAAMEAAIREMKAEKDVLTDADEICLQTELPYMLVELLPKEVQNVLPKEEELSDSDDYVCGGMVLSIEDIMKYGENNNENTK